MGRRELAPQAHLLLRGLRVALKGDASLRSRCRKHRQELIALETARVAASVMQLELLL